MYIFIVNPHARSGLGHIVWKDLELLLNQKNVTYKVYFTKYQKHATEITSQITSDHKKHTIIVLGGDGTINEVINGISNYENITLGYIPIGSSNDFARGMSLSSDPIKALHDILTSSTTKPINIGTIQYGKHFRNFAVSAGFGFDAAVCHEAVISKWKLLLNKLHLGKLTYAGIALHRLFLTNPCKMSLTLDHNHTVSFDSAYFAAIMNQKYEGGGLKFCPDAKPDDGQLDIIVISNVSKLKILSLLPTAFKGWHIHFKGVHRFRCRHLSIEAEQALPVHTDGEPIFLQRNLTAFCSSNTLHIITPK